MHAKEVTSQRQIWGLATMLTDHVHWDIYWQRTRNVSKTDLLTCPCPLAPPRFLSSP